MVAQNWRRRRRGDRQFVGLADGSDVPLIVPEVNADAVAGFTKEEIIANRLIGSRTSRRADALPVVHASARRTSCDGRIVGWPMMFL